MEENVLEQVDQSYSSVIEDPRMDPYLIAFDRKSYIILEKGIREKKDGSKISILRERCYPATFKNALDYVIKQKVHSQSYESLDSFFKAYKELLEDFTARIKF
jgi:hypothetical protein